MSLTAARPGQQDQRTLPSSPTFRSGVNLVTVDVVVRDKQTGRLIPNLTRDDFSVQDENAPQTISSFAAVDLPDARVTRTATGEPARQYAGNDLADGEMPDGRLVAFFINDSSIGVEATSYLRDWLHRYVDGHMADEDQVAIWTVLGSQPEQELTSDRARLDNTIDQITGEAGLLPYRVSPRLTLTLLARLLDRLDTISNRRKVIIYFGALPTTEQTKAGRIFNDTLYRHVVQQAIVVARVSKPGNFRRLRVTVDRPNAVVQARSGYIQVPTASTP